jgi:hypothetical protein
MGVHGGRLAQGQPVGISGRPSACLCEHALAHVVFQRIQLLQELDDGFFHFDREREKVEQPGVIRLL